MADAKSREGETLKGKYRLDRLLGSGGMGDVYRARNVLVDREVAIKMLHRHLIHNPEAVGRFMREARAANAVQHRNIVDVLDIDTDDHGRPFIVQEYLEGTDLAKRLERPPHRLPPAEALGILLPIIEAVGEAHRRGVVHRDLKPENVFLAVADGEIIPKILDFGISKVPLEEEAKRRSHGYTGDSSPRLTLAGSGLGTPYYMSPEQIRDPGAVDARTDVWSLGVVLYETLSGRMPFDAEDLGQLFAVIQTRDPVELSRLAPDVPADLARIVHRCISPEPSDRYPDASALAKALQNQRVRSLAPSASLAPPPSSDAPPTSGPTSGPARPSPTSFDDLELELPVRSSQPARRRRPKASPVLPEDDDVFGMHDDGPLHTLQLADEPALVARPRPAATAQGGPVSAGRRIHLRGRDARGPSVTGPVVLAIGAGVLVVLLYVVVPHLSPAAAIQLQGQLGGAAVSQIYLAATGVLALGLVAAGIIGLRRVSYSLFLATLGLAGVVLGGISALGYTSAPGLIPSTVLRVGFLAAPWSAVAAALGLALHAVARFRAAPDDGELGWLRWLLVAGGGASALAAVGIALTAPRISVAEASQPNESLTRATAASADRLVLSLAGAARVELAHDGLDPELADAAKALGSARAATAP